MKMVLSLSALTLSLSTLMIMINTIISKKTFIDREKSSPFECGFDPKSSARLPFSMHFFLIAVIFLIFDVEITLLMPMVYTLKTSFIKTYATTYIYFIIILVLGVYHEWRQGALTWTK